MAIAADVQDAGRARQQTEDAIGIEQDGQPTSSAQLVLKLRKDHGNRLIAECQRANQEKHGEHLTKIVFH